MDPVKLLLILVTAICYSTAGIINFSDLPIAPDRIYMKHKFMYLEVDEKHKGKLDVEIEITPQNFKEKFSFYLVIVNEELFDTFQKKHVNMEVCTEREDVSLPTYLELGTNVKDLLLNKHYTNNPNEKLIIEYTSNVTVNGMYYTVICVCPNKSEIPEKPTAGLYDYYVDKSKPFVKVSGTIKFKNPVGYLNGVQIPCARYYFFFCLAYIGLAVFWVYKIIQRKEYLIFFHHVISSVFVVSFLETWFIYINYDLYNKNGLRNSFFDYTAGSLTVIKMTSIILISIIVSLGYKITRKSIFEYTMRLIVLGFIYFICSIIFVGEKLYTTYTPIMLSTSLMLKLPFYIINAVAFVWILRALTNTIKILNQTKQSFKTKLFNNFFYGVCIILVILICTCVIQIVLLFMSKWNNIYTELASREVFQTIFTLVIFSIMVTMRPTTKSKFLVHHEELNEEHTEHSVDHEYGPHRASMVNPNAKDLEESPYFVDSKKKVKQTFKPQKLVEEVEIHDEEIHKNTFSEEGEYEEEEEEHEEHSEHEEHDEHDEHNEHDEHDEHNEFEEQEEHSEHDNDELEKQDHTNYSPDELRKQMKFGNQLENLPNDAHEPTEDLDGDENEDKNNNNFDEEYHEQKENNDIHQD